MSYESDITAFILASPSLAAVIGDRFFWDIADGTTATPYVVAQTVSDDGETPHDGRRGASFPTIQFSCWATTKAAAVNLGELLRRELEGVQLPGDSFCSLSFQNRVSTYDTTTRLFGIQIDFRASHQLDN